MPKMRSNDVLADHRAGKAGFRFADFRMPEMLRPRNLRCVDISRNKCLYRASLAGAQAASALPARYTPLSTFRLGKGRKRNAPFMTVTMTLPRTLAAKSGSQTICIAKG